MWIEQISRSGVKSQGKQTGDTVRMHMTSTDVMLSVEKGRGMWSKQINPQVTDTANLRNNIVLWVVYQDL